MFVSLKIPDNMKSDIEAMGFVLLALDRKYGHQFKFYPSGDHGKYSGIGLFTPSGIPGSVESRLNREVGRAYRKYKSEKYFSWFYIAFRLILAITVAYTVFKLSEGM